MINQYLSVKREYPDAILLFRLGDFYEMFYDDAKTASEILGIALTSRDRSKKNPVPLCGVPFHSAEPHISKLLGSGKKVAICEQVGDPKQTKGLVERKVVRVLTPGAVLDSRKPRVKKQQFPRVCRGKKKDGFALCFLRHLDRGVSGPLFSALPQDLLSELAHLDPREILIPDSDSDPPWLKSLLDAKSRTLVTKVDSWKWELRGAEKS